MNDSTRAARAARGKLFVGGVGGLVVLFLAGRGFHAAIPRVTAEVDHLGVFAPIAYALFYAIAEVALVPGSLLTLTAGALFGVVGGTAVAMVGATLGASLAFLLARYVVRRRVEARVQRSPTLQALDAAVEADGLKIVLLVRLTPLIPFNLLNYALGVTRVRFGHFLVGSIGMLPGALLYAYYGHVAGDVARVATGSTPPHDAKYYLVLGVGLVATLALSVVLARLARRALHLPSTPATS